mmetsp:Transcript_6264/g.20063  ORF Transcript_6264/g.20063 Transcript_6264/m.20063 type:complete len:100 (+) Transcript_6264:197-496(+)
MEYPMLHYSSPSAIARGDRAMPIVGQGCDMAPACFACLGTSATTEAAGARGSVGRARGTNESSAMDASSSPRSVLTNWEAAKSSLGLAGLVNFALAETE